MLERVSEMEQMPKGLFLIIRPFVKPPALPVRLEKAMLLRRKEKTISLGVGSHGVERNCYQTVAKFSPCKMGM